MTTKSEWRNGRRETGSGVCAWALTTAQWEPQTETLGSLSNGVRISIQLTKLIELSAHDTRVDMQ